MGNQNFFKERRKKRVDSENGFNLYWGKRTPFLKGALCFSSFV
jgi:hypothetical protein